MKLTNKDWDLLLPGKDVKLGHQRLTIAPMNLEKIKGVSLGIKPLYDEFMKRKITFDNCLKEKLDETLDVLMDKAPDLLAAGIGLSVEDLKRLPIDKTIEIFDMFIQVNKFSKDGLEKNLKSLIVAVPAAINGVSEIVYSFSSMPDTAGKTSKNTPSEK